MRGLHVFLFVLVVTPATAGEIFAYVAENYTDSSCGAPVGDETARRRLNGVKTFIVSACSYNNEPQLRSPLEIFSDYGAIKAFFSKSPLSSRSHLAKCFEEVLNALRRDLTPQDEGYHQIMVVIPSYLSSLKSKASRDYGKARWEVKGAEPQKDLPDFREVQVATVNQLIPRLTLLTTALKSFRTQIRMDEEGASKLMEEIYNVNASNAKPDISIPHLSREEEDQSVFGDAFNEEPSVKDGRGNTTDKAGELLRLSCFPSWIIREITGSLITLILFCFKPERGQSIREMSVEQGYELETNHCVLLKVPKQTCSFDVSMCVVDTEVASLLSDYRLYVRPLILNGRRPQQRGQTNESPTNKFGAEIDELHREFYKLPLATRLVGPQRNKVWGYIVGRLGEKLEKGVALLAASGITPANVQRTYNINNCDTYFLTPTCKPLHRCDRTIEPVLRSLGIDSGMFTKIRAMREQFEFSSGSHESQQLVHAAQSHTRKTALCNYIDQKSTKTELAIHSALTLATEHRHRSIVSVPAGSSHTPASKSGDHLKNEILTLTGRLPVGHEFMDRPALFQRLEGVHWLREEAKREEALADLAHLFPLLGSDLPADSVEWTLAEIEEKTRSAVYTLWWADDDDDADEEDASASGSVTTRTVSGPWIRTAAAGPLPSLLAQGGEDIPFASLLPAADPSPTKKRRRRIEWRDSDRAELARAQKIHGSAFRNMGEDVSLRFQPALMALSEIERGDRLKSYASSPVFRSYITALVDSPVSATNNSSTNTGPAVVDAKRRLPLPFLDALPAQLAPD